MNISLINKDASLYLGIDITSYLIKLSYKFKLDQTVINTKILRINVLHRLKFNSFYFRVRKYTKNIKLPTMPINFAALC